MSHSEKWQGWLKEGVLSLVSGGVYGATTVLIGHPLDTVKTRMQSMNYGNSSDGILSIIKTVWDKD